MPARAARAVHLGASAYPSSGPPSTCACHRVEAQVQVHEVRVAAQQLQVRQVTKWRAQVARTSAEYVESITGERREALGHAKVQLMEWGDRDGDWLQRGAAA